jgi:excisionase family DNA binding protein
MYSDLKTLPKNKEFFRTGEAAYYLELHRNTVREWIDKGYLELAPSPSGKLRITRESLEKYLHRT